MFKRLSRRRPLSLSSSTNNAPIFVVSAPFAGTSLVYDSLRQADAVSTLAGVHKRVDAVLAAAGHAASDRLTAADATPAVIAALRALILGDDPAAGRKRWLNGDLANALRVPFLSVVFPEAQFVYLHRAAEQQIDRMIGAWTSGRFITRAALAGWDGPWSLPLVADWRSLRDQPLADVAAGQWASINATLLADLQALVETRWCALGYTDLLSFGRSELEKIGRFADLTWRKRAENLSATLWHKKQQARPLRNAHELARILPALAATIADAERVYLGHRLVAAAVAPKSASQRLASSVVSGTFAAGLLTATALRPGSADAAIFNVTSLLDDGSAGTLRTAINQANAAVNGATPDVITFDPALNGVITLAGAARLAITEPVDIQGPGASVLTIDAVLGSQAFYINDGGGDGKTFPHPSAATTISGLTIERGQGGKNSGGAIHSSRANLTLDQVVLKNSQANGLGARGGGVFFNGTRPGAPYGTSAGVLTMTQSVVSGNSADEGGGIAVLYPSATISDSTISGNHSNSNGGGLFVTNTSLNMQRSTISGNISIANGGGLFLINSAADSFVDNTVANNAAYYDGGGIHVEASRIRLSSSTVSHNNVSYPNGNGGGGIFAQSPSGGTNSVTLVNTIVAGNTSVTLDNDIGNHNGTGFFTASFSLIQDPGTAALTSGVEVLTGEDPQLGLLQDNGGPTQTMQPALGSPALNTGDPTAAAQPPTTDQRGLPRKISDLIDMGAVEVGTEPQLINVTAEPAGANCANGGERIDKGNDTNDNGTLEALEITSTSYVCNGVDGSTGGGTGPTGPTGPAGPTGATGPAGADGASTGSVGAIGATGPAGADGATGPAGAAGPAGPAGKGGCSNGTAGASLPIVIATLFATLVRRRKKED